jgi:hypothetical protein
MSHPGEHWPRSSPGRGHFLQGEFCNGKAVFRYERSRATPQACFSSLVSCGLVRLHYVHVRDADRHIRSASSVGGKATYAVADPPSSPICATRRKPCVSRDVRYWRKAARRVLWESGRICRETAAGGNDLAPRLRKESVLVLLRSQMLPHQKLEFWAASAGCGMDAAPG